MSLELELIEKYNVSGPRYTSYPTAVQFVETDDFRPLSAELKQYNNRPRDLSLYVHIPFCFSLCWYCGCTKIITKDQDRGDHYLGYLEKEMDLVARLLHPESNVVQIHFGGGTPTFLRPDQLKRLGSAIHKRFRVRKDVEFGVEIDPRSCSRDVVEALAEIGCNRASLGIQDTNPRVQKAVHRIQPVEQNEQVVSWLRQFGIRSVNVDLIYGLPHQTPKTFRRTIDDVSTLDPDRLAVYSYAHIPSLMPAQKLLNEDEFPSSGQKLEMIHTAIEILPEYGYRFIGMDHFARKEDALSLALENGTLQRNFQGYSTLAEADMYAFGMSGISQVDFAYFQNSKDLGSYYKHLDNGAIPVVKQLKLTEDDKIRRDLIMQIMCRTDLSLPEFSQRWMIDFERYFAPELKQLKPLEDDSLLTWSADRIQVTEKGRLFLRNIAMVFDAYLSQDRADQRYSKTV